VSSGWPTPVDSEDATYQDATVEFNALCFGMAVTELLNPSLLRPNPQRAWRAAFDTLISGFGAPAPQRAR